MCNVAGVGSDLPSMAMQRTTFSPSCLRIVQSINLLYLNGGSTHMLSDLENELLVVVGRLQGVQDGRQLGSVELDCSRTLVRRQNQLDEQS
jgi:hypothetical protein